MGVLRRVRENVVKSGHVVGLGSSLVRNPSRESKPIGYVDNSGRIQSEACRFTHGAGWKRFFALATCVECVTLMDGLAWAWLVAAGSASVRGPVEASWLWGWAPYKKHVHQPLIVALV